MQSRDPAITRVPAWVPWARAGAAAAVLSGIVASHGGHPAYSLALHYVSQLAEVANPRWPLFSAGLIVGGVLLVPFAWAARRLLPNADGTRASRLGIVAGVCLALVGVFPLARIVPHFVCAFGLFASAIFAELFVARSLRALAGEDPGGRTRAASLAVYALFVFHVAAAAGGFVYSAVVTRGMPVISAEQMLRDSPLHQQLRLWESGPTVNPVANLEWVFLVSSMGLLLVASARACTLRAHGR